MKEAEGIYREALKEGVHLYVKEGKIAYIATRLPPSTKLKDRIQSNRRKMLYYLLSPEGSKKDTNLAKDYSEQYVSEESLASYPQQRLWFIDQYEPQSSRYIICLPLRIRGEFDLGVAQRSIVEIVKRHLPLRTNFKYVDGEGLKAIPSLQSFEIEDVSNSDILNSTLSQNLIEYHIRKTFDLRVDLNIKASYRYVSEREHMLILSFHHIAFDALSIPVFFGEFTEIYVALKNNRAPVLSSLDYNYANYAQDTQEFCRTDEFKTRLRYWEHYLRGIPERHSLYLGAEERDSVSYVGKKYSFVLDEVKTSNLQKLALLRGTTTFTLLQSLFAIFLRLYSYDPDIVFGIPTANRHKEAENSLIGFFVDTLVFRTTVDSKDKFSDYLEKVKKQQIKAYSNQRVPFDLLVDALNPTRNPRYNPIYQIVFNMNPFHKEVISEEGLEVSLIEYEDTWSRFDLGLTARTKNERLVFTFEYRENLFSRITVQGYATSFVNLITKVLERPESEIRELSFLPLSDIELIRNVSAPYGAYPRSKCIHEIFEEQARRSSDSVALISSEREMTYGELSRRSNQVANYLLSRDVHPGALVGLLIERSFELIVGLVGILKCGCGYVPIDVDYPAHRIRYMIEDSDIRIILSSEECGRVLEEENVDVCFIDNFDNDDQRPEVLVSAKDTAYVIYSSGTTGLPKGVIVEHRSIVNLVCGQEESLFDRNTICLQLSSTSFDAATWEVWGSLLNGGKLVLYENGSVDLYKLDRCLNAMKVNTLCMTTGLFNEWVHSGGQCDSLTYLVVGGDIASAATIGLAHNRHRKLSIVNGYGPTECTTFTTQFKTKKNDSATIPIGTPINNVQVYVLNEAMELLPVGVVGELYIGGDGLARGYLNKPELTKEKFVSNPFGDDGTRLYRSGDLVRWLPDGNLEFIGRVDNQVKIRGFRVELGEIEQTLVGHDSVRDAVVVDYNYESGDKRLVAYCVTNSDEDGEGLEVGELRSYLQGLLPEYMVPSAYVKLESLPLTPNGKIDRKGLPTPDGQSYDHEEYIGPSTDIERALVRIWSDVLEIDTDTISVRDNFFALGGHSLLATRLVSLIREEFDVELPLRELFEAPTVLGLSKALSDFKEVVVLPPIEVSDRSVELPLSYAQQRLWFIDQLGEGSTQYNVPGHFRIEGDFNEEAFKQALSSLIDRHESLRTNFRTIGGEPKQFILDSYSLPYIRNDLTSLETEIQEVELRKAIEEEASRPFDLSNDLMLRVQLIVLSSSEHMVLYTLHHIASDGWSMGILHDEFVELYTAYSEGRTNPLEPLRVQYSDYAVWQRGWLQGSVLEKQLSYWREQLLGIAPSHSLPMDAPRPIEQTYKAQIHQEVVPKSLVLQIRKICEEEEVTLFMLLETVFAVLISRYSNESDVVVGSPIAGRTHKDLESLIGFFVNSLVIRTDVSEEIGFRELLRRNKQTILDAYTNQHVPFEMLVEELRPERSLSQSPVFQIAFAVQNNKSGSQVLANSSEVDIGLLGESLSTRHDLEIHVYEESDCLRFGWLYNIDLFEKDTIERMSTNYKVLLEDVVETLEGGDDDSVHDLNILSEEEKSKQLVDWNDTRVDYPKDKCVHELFEEQARNNPDNVALVYEDAEMTYGELNLRANQVAHYLNSKGVGPDVLVGLLVERSFEMVIGLLGVLKSGGAYVPIDSEYPTARIEYMLKDSEVGIVLSQSTTAEKINHEGVVVVTLDDGLERETGLEVLSGQPSSELEKSSLGLNSNNLAYVIYTSGSTGQPKGVMVEHQSVLNYLLWAINAYCSSVVSEALVSSSLSFDATITSLILPMTCSKTSILLHKEDHIRELGDKIESGSTTFVLKVTPSQIKPLIQYCVGKKFDDKPHVIVIGGEALDIKLVRALKKDVLPNAICVNEYGPTETVVGCAPHTFEEDAEYKSNWLPIGKPIWNTQLYVLNEAMELLPVGVVGELYIGGDGLARGYLNKPELTKEKFVSNPFGDDGTRLYRSGDLVRWLPDGNLEFIGRVDNQVKIRGFRVELGEIEQTLVGHDSVRDAVVVDYNYESGDKRLVAYCVTNSDEDGEGLEVGELRSYLQGLLPEYMVPSAYVKLESLPLTPNGKIDRKGLPTPDGQSYDHEEYIGPSTDIERALVRIWSDVLEIDTDTISVRDNFFALGGHSLLILEIIQKMEEIGYSIRVRDIVHSPIIETIAHTVARTSRDYSSNLSMLDSQNISPSRRGYMSSLFSNKHNSKNVLAVLPLLPVQEGIYFHSVLEENSDPYISTIVIEPSSDNYLNQFVNAVRLLIAKHEALRVAIATSDDGIPHQIVFNEATLSVKNITIRRTSDLKESHGEISSLVQTTSLNTAPLIWIDVISNKYDQKKYIWLRIHHLIVDHVSLDLIMSEIVEVMTNGHLRKDKPISYLDLVDGIHQCSNYSRSKKYYRKLFKDFAEPSAPFELSNVYNNGTLLQEVNISFDSNIKNDIGNIVEKHNTTIAVFMHMVWMFVISKCSDTDDISIGTVFSGRSNLKPSQLKIVGSVANTVPIRIIFSNKTVNEVFLEVKGVLKEALFHDQVSLRKVCEYIGADEARSLFTTLFNYRYSSLRGISQQQNDSKFNNVKVIHTEERTNYPLTCTIDEFDSHLSIRIRTESAVIARRIVQYLERSTRLLLESLKSEESILIESLSVLGDEEKSKQLVDWNDTRVDYPKDKCVHELFEEQARNNPDNVALVYEDAEMTYGELNLRANQVAHYLNSKGVGPDVLVGLLVERSFEMVIGLLGVLKSGGAYVPIDSEYPTARIEYMLKDSEVGIVLSQSTTAEKINHEGVVVVTLDDGLERETGLEVLSGQPSSELEKSSLGLNSNNLAYVIYTSGSTGQPKGVMVEHQSLINRILWMNDTFTSSIDDVYLQKTPYTFDVSVWEFVWPWLTASQLVIAPPGSHLDPIRIAEIIEKHWITKIHFVPQMLQAFVEDGVASGCSSLQHIFSGGESLPPSTTQRLVEVNNKVRLHNLYGPTEATIDVSMYSIEPSRTNISTIPIGRPNWNTQLYVLNEAMELLPVGVVGELYIGGDGLARGYLNKPELTKEKFVSNPFGDDGTRLYRSGDLVRWLPDGNLEFIGRVDNQVKIRGFRVELGEIEQTLVGHDSVRDAVVVDYNYESGDKRLVAYCVTNSDEDGEGLEVGELRSYLQGLLPEYMVPSAYVKLESLPLTPNGKIDRKGLPTPDGQSYDHEEYIGPSTDIERALVRIWSDVLEIDTDTISVRDNFFALGGHSLLATRLVSLIREEFDVELPLRELFEAPTVLGLSKALSDFKEVVVLPPIEVSDRSVELPLSYAQQRLWFIDQLGEGSTQYNVPGHFRIEGDFNEEAFKQALSSLIDRHESLRTNFRTIGGEPKQFILDSYSLPYIRNDLTSLETEIQEVELRKAIEEEASRPFDLSNDLMLRVQLIVLSSSEHMVLYTLHHIASDGWSMGILHDEFVELYTAYSEGRTNPLEPLRVQYSDYAVWQRGWLQGSVLEKQLSYWREQLLGIAPSHSLPMDAPRPIEQTYKAQIHQEVVPKSLVLQIRKICEEEEVTLFMLLETVFAVLISRYSNESDVVVGSPIAGRTHKDLESLIGFFVNSLVIRTDVSEEIGFRELLRRNKQTILDAYTNQHVPFEMLVEELRPERSLSQSPVFQIAFAVQNNKSGSQVLANSSEVDIGLLGESLSTRHDLEIHVYEESDCLRFGWLYNIDLFEKDTIERMSTNYKVLLEDVVETLEGGDDDSVHDLNILSEEEKSKQLVDWNDTRVDYPKDKCVHELFEEQARNNPDNVALVYEDAEMTYGELNLRANQVAHYLNSKGVGPDVLVGLLVERSFEMVIGLLGVLKSGGAYVPIDSEYPTARIEYMLKDSEVGIVLSQSTTAEKINHEGVVVVTLDDGLERETGLEVLSGQPSSELEKSSLGLNSNNLAYVIYTSGSTGQPKGVMVEHQSLINLVFWYKGEYSFDQSKCTLVLSSFCFDLTQKNLLTPMITGGKIGLVNRGDINTQYILNVIARWRVFLINCAPSLCILLKDALLAGCGSNIEYILMGGEPIPDNIVQSWIHSELNQMALVNMYGPTECSDITSTYELARVLEYTIPIGTPINNVQVYVLNEAMELLPVGVVGELYIGGDGLARGYLNKPELTKEKFVSNPFGDDGTRLYRSGDLVRWLPDGNLEFIGRVDNQVKIRGFRVELGEIETLLAKHSSLDRAIVTANTGDKGVSLVAHICPSVDYMERVFSQYDTQDLHHWEVVFDEQYSKDVNLEKTDLDFSGWLSSYTGAPIDQYQMEEWLANTLRIIEELKPRNLLEVGCGTGLLLYRYGEYCDSVKAIDVSSIALEGIERELVRREWSHVELRKGDALSIEPNTEKMFDTVVVNSVVQYFPSHFYFEDMLERLLRVVEPGGRILIGDVRNLDLLLAHASEVERCQLDESVTVSTMSSRVQRRVSQEGELLISPGYFANLSAKYSSIDCVDIMVKRGVGDNEMLRYRYDVVIQVREKTTNVDIGSSEIPWIEFSDFKTLQDKVELASEGTFGVFGVKNSRIAEDVSFSKGLREWNKSMRIHPRTKLRKGDRDSRKYEELDEIVRYAESKGYQVGITWSNDQLDKLDIIFGTNELPCIRSRSEYSQEYRVNYPNMPSQVRSLSTELQAYLENHLPDYMVPSVYIPIEKLPLTPNGKVDRRSLPIPKDEDFQREVYIEPSNHREQVLCEMWSNLLGIERVGVRDDFFALGGHSLLATRLVSLIREEFDVELPLRELFEAPTVLGLSKALSDFKEVVVLPPIEVSDRSVELPLSYAQQRLWFIDQLGEGSTQYNVPGHFRIEGDFNEEAFKQALSSLIDRHESLRTNFRTIGGEPKQFILDSYSLPYIRNDLTSLETEIQEVELRKAIEEEASRPFDLSNDLMLRVQLIVLSSSEHMVLYTLHHIASDGWSMGILHDEFVELYTAYSEGRTNPLEPLRVQYSDYAVWQRGWLQGSVLEKQLSYWREQLLGIAPSHSLPMDAPRPIEQTYKAQIHQEVVPKSLVLQIRKICEEEEVTLFMLLETVFAVLISRYSNESDVVVGSPIAGRTHKDLESLIGFFVNSLVIRTDVSEEIGFRELLRRNKQTILDAYTNQHVPFEMLVEELRPERSMNFNPVFQIMFSVQNNRRAASQSLRNTNVRTMVYGVRRTRFDVEVDVYEVGEELIIYWNFNKSIFKPDSIRGMSLNYLALISGVVNSLINSSTIDS